MSIHINLVDWLTSILYLGNCTIVFPGFKWLMAIHPRDYAMYIQYHHIGLCNITSLSPTVGLT